jgi:hypothetical protein
MHRAAWELQPCQLGEGPFDVHAEAMTSARRAARCRLLAALIVATARARSPSGRTHPRRYGLTACNRAYSMQQSAFAKCGQAGLGVLRCFGLENKVAAFQPLRGAWSRGPKLVAPQSAPNGLDSRIRAINLYLGFRNPGGGREGYGSGRENPVLLGVR